MDVLAPTARLTKAETKVGGAAESVDCSDGARFEEQLSELEALVVAAEEGVQQWVVDAKVRADVERTFPIQSALQHSILRRRSSAWGMPWGQVLSGRMSQGERQTR